MNSEFEEEEEEEDDLRLGESEDLEGLGKTLQRHEASDCLTCVGPTFRYVNGEKTYAYPTFAYIAMKVIGRNISDISVIPSFIHVIYLDLTNNRLTDYSLKPLEEMKQLKALIIDKNLVQSASSVPDMNKLQLLSIKENCLTTCEVRELEEIMYLDLSYNNISIIMPNLWCPYILPKLTELSMRGNGLKKLAGFLFSNLVSLFLGENQIMEIEGLGLLTNLQFLHLRANPLEKLDGFTSENKKLFYLNLRDCKVEKEKEIKKLRALPRLERIVVTGNPVSETDNFRLKLICMLPRLRRINKKIVDDDERLEAIEAGFAMDDADGSEVDEKDED